jgi:hypothetical protein
MAGVPDVVGLLHRADWTELSLAAEVNTGIDPSLAMKAARAARPPWLVVELPEPEDLGGFRSRRRTLLIAPGRRYREEDEESDYVTGCDGERRWMRRSAARMAENELAGITGDPNAPLPTLLCPAPLLTGFVSATPRARRSGRRVLATGMPPVRRRGGHDRESPGLPGLDRGWRHAQPVGGDFPGQGGRRCRAGHLAAPDVLRRRRARDPE